MKCDVLVIGSGLAGSIAALRASELGLNVVLLEGDQESASAWAQGGIVYSGKDDESTLREDLFNSGSRKNNPPAVEVLLQEGALRVEEWLLKKAKVDFDPDRVLEAAHSKARILHVKDHTGASIMQKLRELVLQDQRIQKVSGILVELMLSDRHDIDPMSAYRSSQCCGAYAFCTQKDQVFSITASSTVLASGGFSSLYQHSTGPRTLTGGGIAAAHRVGARTLDLDYVQFHPTALYLPHERRYLLSEALRGHGALLLNSKKERFVNELDPRDVVSKAIHEALLQSGADHIWLDCRAIDNFAERFPSLHHLLSAKGFDATHDLLPVVPAAHYTLGGVWIDTHARSNVPGLFAAGEVACNGLHGSNRLASTSLLDALVFAHRAAESAASHAQSPQTQEALKNFRVSEWQPAQEHVDPALLAQDWQLLRRTLWNYVGLSRTEERLKRAERILFDLRRDIESFYKKSKLNASLIGLRNAVLLGTLVLYAAIRNKPQK